MDITWYGHSCFRIMERGISNLVADPYDESIGYGELNVRGDIVTISHDSPGHNAAHLVKRAEHVLNRPGEYEIGGIFITGIASYNQAVEPGQTRRNIIFVYRINDFTIAHLGDLDHVPGQAQIEELGPIDVLMIPVGGGSALNSTQASEVISLIEPSLVIPMHYKTDACVKDLDPLDRFLKEMGISEYEELDVLRVKGSTFEEETQVIVLRYAQ